MPDEGQAARRILRAPPQRAPRLPRVRHQASRGLAEAAPDYRTLGSGSLGHALSSPTAIARCRSGSCAPKRNPRRRHIALDYRRSIRGANTLTTYTKFPYRTEFPDSSERGRNSKTLEDALQWARWTVHSRWRETNEYGREGEYVHDTELAVITNRNTDYRWIVRRGDHRVEFQTPEMLEDVVSDQSVDFHLTVEEAEALARAAVDAKSKDRRQKALVDQALDQIAVVCRQVRARVEAGDQLIDPWTRAIPRRPPDGPPSPELEEGEEPPRERPRYRPLGDPDNLSLKEAGEILGRKRNTVYLWYKQGKFPPAVDVAPYLGSGTKPVIVVPRYRLEAWQAGERMPPIMQEVLETRGLQEAPWACFVSRRGARKEDIDYWVGRRGLKVAASTTGRKIYGYDLEDGRAYGLREPLDD
jgi:hypothetical protein